jgi:galactose mutarotase-like enzyme
VTSSALSELQAATVDGFAAVALTAGDLEATFVPSLGMVATSLRHRGEELLGQREGLRAYADRGATMGIPILHPWANRLAGDEYAVDGRRVRLPADAALVRREEHGLAIHGLLAASPHWRCEPRPSDGGRARLSAELDFAAHEELMAGFPFAHRLALDVALDPESLTIQATVRATGTARVPVAFGFHPYLRLPGLARADWTVSLPARRLLITDERGIPTGATAPAAPFDGPLDGRTYDDGFDDLPPRPSFVLQGGGRRVSVAFLSGFPVAQVFAPPGEDVICFEPMTAPTNALVTGRDLPLVAPGESYAAAFEIRVVDG